MRGGKGPRVHAAQSVLNSVELDTQYANLLRLTNTSKLGLSSEALPGGVDGFWREVLWLVKVPGKCVFHLKDSAEVSCRIVILKGLAALETRDLIFKEHEKALRCAGLGLSFSVFYYKRVCKGAVENGITIPVKNPELKTVQVRW